MKAKRVLILCTGNACRSQLAEALWRQEARRGWEVLSAGTDPQGVHPLTIRVLDEIGVPTQGLRSKHLNEIDLSGLDLVITVCDRAREACPVLPGSPQTLHWPFQDPAAAIGSEEEVLAVFRRIRDEIHNRIRKFLAEEPSRLGK